MPASLEDPPKEITLSLPSSLLNKVELLLYDPVRSKVKYAARSHLVAQLLNEWVEKQLTKEPSDG